MTITRTHPFAGAGHIALPDGDASFVQSIINVRFVSPTCDSMRAFDRFVSKIKGVIEREPITNGLPDFGGCPNINLKN